MSIALDRVPLSELLAANQQDHLEPVVPFAAFRDEIPVIVVAVLERTAAYHAIGDSYDTGVIRLDRCFVDPASVEWKAKAGDVENGQKKPGGAYRNYRPNASAGEQARALSDKRALADQQAKREEKTMTRGVNPRAAEERERLAAAGLKRCPKCKLEKPKDQFSATASYCRPCTALISAQRAASRPIKRSVKAKASRKTRAIPVETKLPAGHVRIDGAIVDLHVKIPVAVKGAGAHEHLTAILGDLKELDRQRSELVERAVQTLRAMVSA